ncbi:hypothetical protein [Methylococcus geothermalis]|uniref:Uncharacterized protein n=1 Tax=Methylococcus geothermalis TaxID=2681310 RepID=A0A858QAC7_9GAMM|nr:hypothetical protein [Methylococcus geothermalis]QJD30790.1 hypothetical protein GNH96_12975 [Methylococcus geothermalis]
MSGTTISKKLSALAVAGILHGITASVWAHSLIIVPNGEIVEEWVTAKYRIQHGCEEQLRGAKPRPIIAQSFLLPTVNPVLSRDDGGQIQDTDGNGIVDLNDVIQGGSLIGQVTPLVDSSVFKNRRPITDALGNVLGFNSTNGKVPPGGRIYAEVPFVVTPVFFVEASCATRLVVHPVGADICKLGVTPNSAMRTFGSPSPPRSFLMPYMASAKMNCGSSSNVVPVQGYCLPPAAMVTPFMSTPPRKT